MSDLQRLTRILRSYVGSTWERIQSLERQLAEDELNRSIDPGGAAGRTEPAPAPAMEPEAQARTILGVDAAADFEQIRRAYLKMIDRTQADRFDPDSTEARQAEQIRRRAQWAYQTLTADTPSTDKRFKSLEID